MKRESLRAATLSDGTYSVPNIPAGNYTLHISCNGCVESVVGPVKVVSGEVTRLGVERMTIARGGLRGIFTKGDVDPTGDHSGITVTAWSTTGGVPVDTTVTDATGAWADVEYRRPPATSGSAIAANRRSGLWSNFRTVGTVSNS